MHGANADLMRLHDAGDIPVNLATLRTALPAANSCLAFSTLAAGIGGRPNRTDAARAAACPRRIRSRRDWRRWSAIIPARSKMDRPLLVAVSRRCSCKYNATLEARHVSTKPTSSASERPTRSILLSITLSTEAERIASSNALWPGRRSRPLFMVVGRSMNTLAASQPLSAAMVRRLATCSSADNGQSSDERA